MSQIMMAGAAALLAAALQAQELPRFEVASVRPGQGTENRLDSSPGSLTIRNAPLSRTIRWAYGIEDHQLAGPGWLDDLRFDIVAKAGSAAPESELRRMLQSLLAERFQLSVHRETREMQAFVMTVGKNGHKLKPVDVAPEETFKTGKLSLTGNGATVAQLSSFLGRQLRMPIIDQTGLTGRFNYALDINQYITEEVRASQPAGGGPPPDGPSIIAQALQAQLGLKLDSKKMPIEMLVVDRVERTPSGN